MNCLWPVGFVVGISIGTWKYANKKKKYKKKNENATTYEETHIHKWWKLRTNQFQVKIYFQVFSDTQQGNPLQWS